MADGSLLASQLQSSQLDLLGLKMVNSMDNEGVKRTKAFPEIEVPSAILILS